MLKIHNVSVSKHLRGEKRSAWIGPPTWKLDFTYPLVRADYASPPQSPQAALRVSESLPTAKMLKKNLNYLNISLYLNKPQKIF